MTENIVQIAKFTAKAMVFMERTESCFVLCVTISEIPLNIFGMNVRTERRNEDLM